MPLGQVAAVLNRAWGKVARALQPLRFPTSGRCLHRLWVHEATTRDAARLAVKIQYPGIRDSIDSDVDNVARLLSMARVLPDSAISRRCCPRPNSSCTRKRIICAMAEHLEAYRRRLEDQARFSCPRWCTLDHS